MSTVAEAQKIVAEFEKKSINSSWKNVTQAEMVTGLRKRLSDPDLIDSSLVNLCGPAAFFHNLAKDDPAMYAAIGADLYGPNVAKLGSRQFWADPDLMNATPPSGMDAVDWVILGGLRDHENTFLDYDDSEGGLSGLSMPGALEGWFEQAGYSSVKEETNLFFTKSESNMKKAGELVSKGHRVCLLIHSQMLRTTTQGHRSAFPNHWVVLRSAATIANSKISFKVHSWGKVMTIPQNGSLSVADFEKNYYGFVSGQP